MYRVWCAACASKEGICSSCSMLVSVSALRVHPSLSDTALVFCHGSVCSVITMWWAVCRVSNIDKFALTVWLALMAPVACISSGTGVSGAAN